MQADNRRLQEILSCADELAEYLTGHTQEDYRDSGMMRRAAERLLTIIGEAAKSLTDETRAAISQPWREIIRFRDKGIHHYDALDPQIVYAIATQSVPELAQAIRGRLGK